MNRKIVSCLILAVFSTMVNSFSNRDECEAYLYVTRVKLSGIRENMTRLMLKAERTIDNTTSNMREEAIISIHSMEINWMKQKKYLSFNDFCESRYLDKKLNDAFEKINCCVEKKWDSFVHKTSYGILPRVETLLGTSNSICRSFANQHSESEKSWMQLELEVFRATIEKIRKQTEYVEMHKNAIDSLRRAVNSCGRVAIEYMKRSVLDDLELYPNCFKLEESINWEESQC